jgi:hypothetical protein
MATTPVCSDYFDVKVQWSATKDSIPAEFIFVSSSEHDPRALRKLPKELPAKI